MTIERETIERIYRDCYPQFARALATVTGSAEGAHDAVQEGFARALAKRRQFRGGSPEAWIWTIAYRCALRARNGHAPAEEVEPQLADPTRDPELAFALQALPPRRRLMVFLRYYADFDYAQIAQICEVSEGTVAATLAQARSELRRILTQGASRERQPL